MLNEWMNGCEVQTNSARFPSILNRLKILAVQSFIVFLKLSVRNKGNRGLILFSKSSRKTKKVGTQKRDTTQRKQLSPYFDLTVLTTSFRQSASQMTRRVSGPIRKPATEKGGERAWRRTRRGPWVPMGQAFTWSIHKDPPPPPQLPSISITESSSPSASRWSIGARRRARLARYGSVDNQAVRRSRSAVRWQRRKMTRGREREIRFVCCCGNFVSVFCGGGDGDRTRSSSSLRNRCILPGIETPHW